MKTKVRVTTGLVFVHRSRIDVATGAPELYRVTRRIGTAVYYRPVNTKGEYTGTSWKCNLDYFHQGVFGSLATLTREA